MAPALIALAGTMVWTGEFDEAEQWLQRTERSVLTDTGPDVGLLAHMVRGMLQAGRGRDHEALASRRCCRPGAGTEILQLGAMPGYGGNPGGYLDNLNL